ncbi:MAG: MBL fold metallo-hydrolase [Nitrososphaerota archaeon]|nr:MBL fold metallo-hydrolase [Nitrososphaerota archaeon]
MGFSNAFVVELDGQGLAVIDTGTSGKEKKILEYVASLGRKPADVSFIVLTHPDADHSGSVAALKRLTGARLAIGELDAPRLSGEKKLKEARGFGRLMLGVFGSMMKVERVKADLELEDGASVGPLTVIGTPGHTDGSVSLYLPGTAIFVGDLLRTDGSGKLKLASANMSRDMEEVKRSVEKISKLEFQQLLPGHGLPIQEGASKKLRDFVTNGFKSARGQ